MQIYHYQLSYCIVKVINDILILLVKQYVTLKRSNTLVKRLVFIVCIDNEIKTTKYHCKNNPSKKKMFASGAPFCTFPLKYTGLYALVFMIEKSFIVQLIKIEGLHHQFKKIQRSDSLSLRQRLNLFILSSKEKMLADH